MNNVAAEEEGRAALRARLANGQPEDVRDDDDQGGGPCGYTHMHLRVAECLSPRGTIDDYCGGIKLWRRKLVMCVRGTVSRGPG